MQLSERVEAHFDETDYALVKRLPERRRILFSGVGDIVDLGGETVQLLGDISSSRVLADHDRRVCLQREQVLLPDRRHALYVAPDELALLVVERDVCAQDRREVAGDCERVADVRPSERNAHVFRGLVQVRDET